MTTLARHDESTRRSKLHQPAYQAFLLLRAAFTLAPIVAAVALARLATVFRPTLAKQDDAGSLS